jgi:hypothetical protein
MSHLLGGGIMNRWASRLMMVSTLMGLVVTSTFPFPQAQEKRSFNSEAQFLSASLEDVKTRLDATPLDPTKPIDKQALDLMKELDAFNNMSTKIYSSDGHGSSAHPLAGVGFDRSQVAQYYNKINKDVFREIIKFVLAHEQAHMAQFQYYNLENLKDSRKTRAKECQADILGGLTVATSFLVEGKSPEYNHEAGKAWMDFVPRLGSPEWDDQTKHPTSAQRVRAMTLGLNAGIYRAWIIQYKQTNDPKLLAQIQDYRKKVPDLFEMDEDLFVWSNRIAKMIVNYQ